MVHRIITHRGTFQFKTECSPLITRKMEKYVKLYPSDSLIHQIHAALAAACYLSNKKKGIKREAW